MRVPRTATPRGLASVPGGTISAPRPPSSVEAQDAVVAGVDDVERVAARRRGRRRPPRRCRRRRRSGTGRRRARAAPAADQPAGRRRSGRCGCVPPSATTSRPSPPTARAPIRAQLAGPRAGRADVAQPGAVGRELPARGASPGRRRRRAVGADGDGLREAQDAAAALAVGLTAEYGQARRAPGQSAWAAGRATAAAARRSGEQRRGEEAAHRISQHPRNGKSRFLQDGSRDGPARRRADRLRPVSGIGVLREGPLHAAVKDLLARPGDTRRGAVRPLRHRPRARRRRAGRDPDRRLLAAGAQARRAARRPPHADRPSGAAERRIVRVDDAGRGAVRRGARRCAGAALDVFDRLVSFPSLLAHPNLDGRGAAVPRGPHPGAGGGALALGPAAARSGRAAAGRGPGQRGAGGARPTRPRCCPRRSARGEPFTTRELAAALGCRMMLAQRVAYCLRGMEVLADAGKRGPRAAAPAWRR